jgi:hypothetical protein
MILIDAAPISIDVKLAKGVKRKDREPRIY